MSVFSYLKSVFQGWETKQRYHRWFNNSTPIFSSFGKNIYLSDYVNNAIDRIASEVSKIEIKSVVQLDGTIQVQNDDITRLFRFKPNPLQTTSDFLSNVEWLRRKNNNAFIYPVYEMVTAASGKQYRRYLALYPLKPQSIYIGVNGSSVWEIRMDFEDGSSYTLPYADLIHLKWRRGANTIIGGGDDDGLPNDYDILRTIDALDKTIQGLPKSIEASLQIKGVYSAKTLGDIYKLGKIRDDFEAHITTSKSGIIATDLGGEFTPANLAAPDIPDSAMKFLKAVLSERYGVSAAILSGDYNGEQHSAFYQTAIEDVIVQIEQAGSACLFSTRERDVGHQLKCYYSKVNYMNSTNKIELAKISTNTRLMTLNQIAEMFGLEPFEGGDIRLQSLNFVDSSIINQYQLSNSGPPSAAVGAVGTEGAEDAEDAVQDVAGKSLNGAQTQSLLAVMQQYVDGKLSIGQAVNVIAISIGVTKQQAKEIIEGLE